MSLATKPYEATDPMPGEYRDLLIRLLMIQADTETRILFDDWPHYARFPEFAPTPEDRMVTISYLREEAGHGYMAYKLLADLGVHLTAKDFEGKKHFLYVFDELPESWTELALFNCLADRAGRYQAEEWIDCSYAPLARVAPGVVKDETGHGNLGYQNLKRICQTAEGRAEAERLLPKWYAIALDMFGRRDSKRDERYRELGLKRRSNEEARQVFIAEVTPLLEGLGFTLPDPTTGRRYL